MPTSTYDIGQQAYQLQNIFNMNQEDLFDYALASPGGADFLNSYYGEDVPSTTWGMESTEWVGADMDWEGMNYATFVQQQLDSGLSLDDIEGDINTALSPFLTNILNATYTGGWAPINPTNWGQSQYGEVDYEYGSDWEAQGTNFDEYMEGLYGENWQDYQTSNMYLGGGFGEMIYSSHPGSQFEGPWEGVLSANEMYDMLGLVGEEGFASSNWYLQQFMHEFAGDLFLTPDDPNAMHNLQRMRDLGIEEDISTFKLGTLDPLRQEAARSNVAMSTRGGYAIDFKGLADDLASRGVSYQNSLTNLYNTFGEDFISQLTDVSGEFDYEDYSGYYDPEWTFAPGASYYPTPNLSGITNEEWEGTGAQMGGYTYQDCVEESTANLIEQGWGIDAWGQAASQCQEQLGIGVEI